MEARERRAGQYKAVRTSAASAASCRQRRHPSAEPGSAGREPKEAGGVRIAVIGCGAVGSIFAANLAQLDDVEVWAYDLWAGHVVGPGHVGWDTKGDTHIGPFEPSPAPMEKVQALADVCTRAGLPTRALEDARGAQWRKLIFNAASNAIGALTGLTHGQIAEPPTRELAWAVMAEGRAVSDAQGISLDTSPEELFDFAARKEIAYDHKPSMLQDVEAGRPTEIDFLNGAVVSFGERHGVDAPLNRALTALVKGLERS